MLCCEISASMPRKGDVKIMALPRDLWLVQMDCKERVSQQPHPWSGFAEFPVSKSTQRKEACQNICTNGLMLIKYYACSFSEICSVSVHPPLDPQKS